MYNSDAKLLRNNCFYVHERTVNRKHFQVMLESWQFTALARTLCTLYNTPSNVDVVFCRVNFVHFQCWISIRGRLTTQQRRRGWQRFHCARAQLKINERKKKEKTVEKAFSFRQCVYFSGYVLQKVVLWFRRGWRIQKNANDKARKRKQKWKEKRKSKTKQKAKLKSHDAITILVESQSQLNNSKRFGFYSFKRKAFSLLLVLCAALFAFFLFGRFCCTTTFHWREVAIYLQLVFIRIRHSCFAFCFSTLFVSLVSFSHLTWIASCEQKKNDKKKTAETITLNVISLFQIEIRKNHSTMPES